MRKTEDVRGEKVIDSRDVIERLEQLEEWRASAIESATDEDAETWTSEDGTVYGECADWDEETASEWIELRAFADDAESVADWWHGEAFIRDDYFVEYAEELANDLGLTMKSNEWPYCHIDWEEAAEALKQDYSLFTLGSYEYWARS